MRCVGPMPDPMPLLFCPSFPPGRIGPPKLGIRKKQDQIIIDIFHPLAVINGKEPEAIYDEENNCHMFMYNVYVRINGSDVCISISFFFKTEIFLLLA